MTRTTGKGIETTRKGIVTSWPEYKIWAGMKDRCHNPDTKDYKNYGARGIKVCPKWLNSFDAFIQDMGLRPSTLHSLDRIGNNSPYAPWNCRWTTAKVQARNRRSTKIVQWKGESRLLIELAEEYGLSDMVLRGRMWLGWTLERALTQPVRKVLSEWELQEIRQSDEPSKVLAARYGVGYSSINAIRRKATGPQWKRSKGYQKRDVFAYFRKLGKYNLDQLAIKQ